MRVDINYDIYKELTQVQSIKSKIEGKPNIKGISIDSRKIQKDDMFIAVKGENFNGNDFLKEACDKGASLIICSEENKLKDIKNDINYILVENTIDFAQKTAKQFLLRFDNSKKAVITGSIGKTTVKEMVGSILSFSEAEYFINQKNYNSQIGLPLSILSIKNEPELMVFEIGMSQKGEIYKLSEIIVPDIALILNIKDVHREYFDSIYGIRDAKLELIDNLKKDGTIIFYRNDDILYAGILEKWNGKTVRYSLNDKYSIKPHRYHHDDLGFYSYSILLPSGKPVADIKLSVPGEHNLLNSVSALCLCDILGIEPYSIKRGLSSYKPASMRSHLYKVGNTLIYEDCYNSSPYALKKTIDAFGIIKSKKEKTAILGDMLELGTESARYHIDLLEYAINSGIDHIITIGKDFYKARDSIKVPERERVYSFLIKNEALTIIKEKVFSSDKILIKGSRGLALESILQVVENTIHTDNL